MSPSAQREYFTKKGFLFYLEHCTEELLNAYVNYMLASVSESSALNPIFYAKLYIGGAGYTRRTLCSSEFLLNCSKFPIGIAYGDRDFLGSMGADWIIKTNAFFKTGEA